MIKIIEKRKIWYMLSLIVALICGLFIYKNGFRLGIDFTGGTLMELKFEKEIKKESLMNIFQKNNVNNVQIQIGQENRAFIKTANLENEVHKKIIDDIKKEIGAFSEVRFENVGPTVGKDTTQKFLFAMILVSLGIILYLSFSFRKIKRPLSSWYYGFSAVLALIHDMIITTGVFGIAAYFMNWYADSFFVTALLTMISFSVHDTIVIFDRIRENLLLKDEKNFEAIVNFSVNQSIIRSLITSSIILITLLSLFVFGGSSLKPFVFTLIVGMISGTYSSIFLASPILVDLGNFVEKRKKNSK